MPSRSERLFAALAARGADAFVSSNRPNQLYLLDHPDPSAVISRPNCAAIIFAPSQTVVFPGVWISNACRDLLTNCEVVPNEEGDPPRAQQLAVRMGIESYKKVVTDSAGCWRWHRLRHGLGLGGDRPRIAADGADVLQVGDALSCEPGLYIPGLGGARVENMIYVGEDGPEELTRCPLDLRMGG